MKKTPRIYVVNIEAMEENPTPQEINKWNLNDELPQDALDFIEIAEEQGTVYNILEGFASDFNKELVCTATDMIFVTDKY